MKPESRRGSTQAQAQAQGSRSRSGSASTSTSRRRRTRTPSRKISLSELDAALEPPPPPNPPNPPNPPSLSDSPTLSRFPESPVSPTTSTMTATTASSATTVQHQQQQQHQQRQHPLSPSLELLPPSPTRSHSSLEFPTSDEDADAEPAPSRLEEIARICVGRASVRSRERERARAGGLTSLFSRTEDDRDMLGIDTASASASASAWSAPPSPLQLQVSPGLSDISTRSNGSQLSAASDASTGTGFSRWWPRSRPPKSPPIVLAVGEHAGERDPFATDVVVKGWQVVGGKSWTGGGKVGAYVVYEIDITLRSGTSVSILRRYTEFVRLRDELRAVFPHLSKTIPALPGKNHMSKFSPEFLEDRRPRLQRFLRTVMLHPEMGIGGEESVIGRWVLKRK